MVWISSGFIGCRCHDHFLEYVQDLVFTYTIYVSFIDAITIIFGLDNLIPFFILKIRRGWSRIVVSSFGLLFELVVYPIHLRVLFLKCWFDQLRVWEKCPIVLSVLLNIWLGHHLNYLKVKYIVSFPTSAGLKIGWFLSKFVYKNWGIIIWLLLRGVSSFFFYFIELRGNSTKDLISKIIFLLKAFTIF